MNIDGENVEVVSNGEGRTTCSYFFKGGKKILYATTFLGDKKCPPPADFSKGYVWAIYPGYDIVIADADGKNIKRLTATRGYDAEATISPDGKKIIFTSTRDGDLDLYSMDANGKNVKRLTDELGYDGGAFYSPDSKQIVYRAFHPKTPQEIARYKDRLANNLIEQMFDELPENSTCEHIKNQLDYWAIEIGKIPNSIGYAVVYEGNYSRYIYDAAGKETLKMSLPAFGESIYRTHLLQKYLFANRKISPDKIIFVDGGFREKHSVELWVVPNGANPPKPTPTLENIKHRKGKPKVNYYNC